MTDEEKKDAFLQSRGRQTSGPTAPPPVHAPPSKPTPAKNTSSSAKTQAKNKKKAKPKAAPKKPKSSTGSAGSTEKRPSSPSSTPSRPAPTPTQRREIPPKPSPTPGSRPETKSAVVIEKSGLADTDETVPPPAQEKRGWFLFKRSPQYKYLTPAVRAAIDKAPVKKHRWLYIVVHNSGTRQGNAKAFDYYHRNVRKMQNGLAYHFVIGNGTSSGNGGIEIGPRWRQQINGGHVRSDYLNNIALGICLVGDYNRDKPTQQQLEALEELIRYLRTRVGKTNRKQATVKTHKDINPVPTDCPGDRFPYRWFYSRFD